MQHIAHISEDGERSQSVDEHTCGTAKLCAEFGRGAGLENFCFLCGIFHDAGKLTRDFTEYILGENNYGRGDIDHAFAGAKYLHELCAGTPYAEAADLDAPVIATTFVQFLNSLFLGSMAAVRRFHRLENSVMILDEVQSLPLKCVYMFDLAVNFLSKIMGCTVRSLAGLDNIAQAAGRCNRNGERESANVYVINIADENLDRLQEIRCRGNTAAPLLEKAESDILGSEMVVSYFRRFYDSNSELLKFPTADGRDLLDMLSLNEKSAGKNKKPSYTNQAFAAAGRIFEVIDNDQFSVCVPYNDEARRLITDLGSDISFEDFRLVRRKLQKYTVGTYYKDALVKSGALVLHEKYGIYSVAESYYSQEYGLVLEDTESLPDMMY